MGYYGRVEVEVRLMRQGHGVDSSGEAGSGFGCEAKRVVRIEERVARAFVEMVARGEAAEHAGKVAGEIKAAVKSVLDESDLAELHERWRNATARLDADKMRAALEVLEGS